MVPPDEADVLAHELRQEAGTPLDLLPPHADVAENPEGVVDADILVDVRQDGAPHLLRIGERAIGI